MEPLLILQGVREISKAARPGAPEAVSQRTFDVARTRSKKHADLPAARRITEQLDLSWREVLEVAQAPVDKHSFLLGRKGVEEFAQDWLTEGYVAFVLRLVARRLKKATLTPGEYRAERDAMLREDRARWMHGRQLLLPNEDQIRAAVIGAVRGAPVAGGWDAALRLAGLATNERGPSKIKQTILTRMEVMERFYDHYGERPTIAGLQAFARGNKLPMSDERKRPWAESFADWEAQRRDRGLPAPRVVKHPGGPHRRAPDYSADVGAAKQGEGRYRGKWGDPDSCTAWIKRYLATLRPGERSTVRGYDDWAREQSAAPRASKFGQHGGWEKLRREAQEGAAHAGLPSSA